MQLPPIPAVKPTVTPREEVYGARLQSYSLKKDVTDEFEVEAFEVPSVPGFVYVKLLHKPCARITHVALHVDAFFNCPSCGKGYQIASIIPLKIVEVN
jgi:hypothetical protein